MKTRTEAALDGSVARLKARRETLPAAYYRTAADAVRYAEDLRGRGKWTGYVMCPAPEPPLPGLAVMVIMYR